MALSEPPIADVVTRILDQKGWTLQTLARRARMSASGLRRLLRGHVANAQGPTVRDLARALGVDPEVVRAGVRAQRAASGVA